MTAETELQMVQRHVQHGAAVLLRQAQLVVDMEGAGHDAREAKGLLRSFEGIQNLHLAHLVRITKREPSLGRFPPPRRSPLSSNTGEAPNESARNSLCRSECLYGSA